MEATTEPGTSDDRTSQKHRNPGTGKFGLWGRKDDTDQLPESPDQDTLVREAKALLVFVIERGISLDLPASVEKPNGNSDNGDDAAGNGAGRDAAENQPENKCDGISGTQFIAKFQTGINDYERAQTVADRDCAYVQISSAYYRLASITYPTLNVNGHTILDTKNLFTQTFSVTFIGVVLFVLAISTEILGRYYADIDPDTLTTGFGRFLFFSYFFGARFLSPFFWGGLGAAIYLARTLTEKGAAQTFDSDRLKGHRVRIFLGGVFAVVVVELLPIQTGALTGFENITPAAIAFLTGLGVKAVYGAFEKVVDEIHDRISRIGTQPQSQESGK